MRYPTTALQRLRIVVRPVLFSLVLGLLSFSGVPGAEEPAAVSLLARAGVLQPGETLSYDVSWSDFVTAGTAVMEIKAGTQPDGEQVLRFIATTHSAGMVDKFYRVNDRLESFFSPGREQSMKFSLNQRHGKKKSRRELVFDPLNKTVTSTKDDDAPETLTVPDQTQDALSSLTTSGPGRTS